MEVGAAVPVALAWAASISGSPRALGGVGRGGVRGCLWHVAAFFVGRRMRRGTGAGRLRNVCVGLVPGWLGVAGLLVRLLGWGGASLPFS